MRVTLCLLLSAVCALADQNVHTNTNRRTKPFIADAVGNTLPPPSNVPATVGSPISLLTPDRYEFYTFDESGELVKRLMTLEEIQAIVAAGEDSDGQVTFANDNQPTIAFNFSQPPYTKVHSVVTNVQNVLKAQMEAHKNKPLVQPTLDTPDVSDSWSLILPSIFGNSGVDIVPDKPASSFIPETDTIEESLNTDDEENSLSKEGGSQISSSAVLNESSNSLTTTTTEPVQTTPASSTSTTTTTKPTTTKKVTTTAKPLSTTTIRKKLVTTFRPRTTTTKQAPIKLLTTTTTTTIQPTTITSTPSTTTVKPTTTTTAKPTTSTTAKLSTTTTTKPATVTRKQTTVTSTTTTKEYISNDIPTAKPIADFEKLSTFIPISTAKYVTERTTRNPVEFTKAPFVYALTTKRSPSFTTKSPRPLSSTTVPELQSTVKTPTSTSKTIYVTLATKDPEQDRVNLTTLTTQSVSPSTTASSTEILSMENSRPDFSENGMKEDDAVMPLFDVAQSISQIASDLGNNYQPIPTSSNLLDNNKLNVVDMESKENLDMDIPNEDLNKNKNEENFVKISTIDPHSQRNVSLSNEILNSKDQPKVSPEITTTTENTDLTTTVSLLSESTTIDPILSESMGNLLSQVVHEAPKPNLEKIETSHVRDITTEKTLETTKSVPEFISEISVSKDFTSTTVKTIVSTEKESFAKVTTENDIITKTTEKPTSSTLETAPVKLTSEKQASIRVTTLKPTFIQATTEKQDLYKETTKQQVSTETTTEKQSFTKATTDILVPINMNNDKTIPSEKDVMKVVSPTNNKVNTSDKIYDKGDDSKDFVKISISVPTNKENIALDEKKDDSNKITLPLTKEELDKKGKPIEQNVKVPTTELTTSMPTETMTETVLPTNTRNKTTVSQSNNNKISAEDKLSSINKKNKLPDLFPKVDDFKKKIQKVNDEELANDRNDPWKLIPTVAPPKGNDISKDKLKPEVFTPSSDDDKNVVLEVSKENQGLEVTTKDLGEDIAQFTELCNELAFRYWNTMVESVDKKRSFVLSPYSITSMLAMMFMGARGSTSGEMNEILKLDDMVTFNPHFTLKNISDSIESATNSGITVSAFVRELFSDRTKGKILTFYKERAQHFYNGHVEEINFKLISDIIRRRTNLLVKKHTWGKIPEFMKTNSIVMKPPLAAFSTNIYQTDCTGTSVDGRDGEMYFVVSPNVRQRRLVPVPAVVYKNGFLAGYDPSLDATAAALGNTNSIVSTIFLMPGQQGNIVHSDDLEKLEQRLLEANPTTPVWNRVLRTLLPRVGLELQIPRFSHKSVFNVSSTLREMGLKDLFDPDHADLGGLNGPSKDLYLSDMIQMSSFVTCGEGMVGEQHHVEEYPESLTVARRRTSRWADWDEPRDYQRAFHDPHDVGEAMHLPLHLRPRQARLPTRSVQAARLKFDRPFLFFVRHNPSGMILYVGRYNPRLLP